MHRRNGKVVPICSIGMLMAVNAVLWGMNNMMILTPPFEEDGSQRRRRRRSLTVMDTRKTNHKNLPRDQTLLSIGTLLDVSKERNVPLAITTDEPSPVEHNKIVGNVTHLLDVAILGFAKCGTSTLSAWLESHPNMKSIPGESFALFGNEPHRLASWLHAMRQDSLHELASSNHQTTASTRIPQQFYKQPKDAYRPHVIKALQTYWPNTKLIYTLRHPVHWFESYWNFRYRRTNRKPPIPHSVLGRKGTLTSAQLIYEPIHTGLGEYHVFMSMLGKTLQRNQSQEWGLLKPFLKPSEYALFPFEPTSNRIFVLEASQLSDTNRTRLERLQQDLSAFLQLSEPLSLPIPHVRPEEQFLNATQLRQHYQTRFDICQNRYRTLRAMLVWMGTASAEWLREHFLKHRDVFYSSVDGYLEDNLFASWSEDPCESRN